MHGGFKGVDWIGGRADIYEDNGIRWLIKKGSKRTQKDIVLLVIEKDYELQSNLIIYWKKIRTVKTELL